MSGDLARNEVKAHPKPAARPKKPRRTNLETSAAWYQNVIHKRDAAIWSSEDYPVVAGPGMPLLTETTDPVETDDVPLHRLPHPPFHAHHIVPRQQCRKHGVPEWDVRNGVPVTKRRHERHHSRVEPIHCSELPDEIYGFLAEYPALWPYFNRTYPEATSANVGRSSPDFATKAVNPRPAAASDGKGAGGA